MATILLKMVYFSTVCPPSVLLQIGLDSGLMCSSDRVNCIEEVAVITEQFFYTDEALTKGVLANPHHTLHVLLALTFTVILGTIKIILISQTSKLELHHLFLTY